MNQLTAPQAEADKNSFDKKTLYRKGVVLVLLARSNVWRTK